MTPEPTEEHYRLARECIDEGEALGQDFNQILRNIAAKMADTMNLSTAETNMTLQMVNNIITMGDGDTDEILRIAKTFQAVTENIYTVKLTEDENGIA